MNPQDIQDKMTPEEAKASLGHSTALVERLLAMGAPQTPQNAQGEDQMMNTSQDAQMQSDPRVDDLMSQFESFKQEVKSNIKTEIDNLRQDIKDAISSDSEDNSEDKNEDESKD